MTARDRRAQAAAALRTEIARITAETRARLDALVVPDGAGRAVRAEIRAARQKVWAERGAAIEATTAAHRARLREDKTARHRANAAAHRAATAAHRARSHADYVARGAERAERTAQENQIDAERRAEAALYRLEGTTQ